MNNETEKAFTMWKPFLLLTPVHIEGQTHVNAELFNPRSRCPQAHPPPQQSPVSITLSISLLVKMEICNVHSIDVVIVYFLTSSLFCAII